LVKELQSLCLDVRVLSEETGEVEIREGDDDSDYRRLDVNIEGMESDEDDLDRFIYRKEPKEETVAAEAEAEIIEDDDDEDCADEEFDLIVGEDVDSDEEESAPAGIQPAEVEEVSLDQLEEEESADDDDDAGDVDPKRAAKKKVVKEEPDEEPDDLEDENIY
jgi:hypothetical protein